MNMLKNGVNQTLNSTANETPCIQRHIMNGIKLQGSLDKLMNHFFYKNL